MFVQKGVFEFFDCYEKGPSKKNLSQGAFIGETMAVIENSDHKTSLKAKKDAVVLRISREDWDKFLLLNPGCLLLLLTSD